MTSEEKIKNQLTIKDSELCNAKSGAICFKSIYKENKKEIKKKDVKTFLTAHFDLKDYPLFSKRFNYAVSGDGHEERKMISIKSSSLCALLFFFNVSEGNPIIINGQKYTESFFEVKNQVFNRPSNMDVVLTNEEEKRILFIECKFSEYLNQGKVQISNAYRNNVISSEIYDAAIKEQLFKETSGKPKDGYSYYISDGCYMGGLKQIISHYVGLTNYAKRNIKEYMKEERQNREIYNNEYKSISFIEVLFELDGFKNERTNYEIKSNNLLKIINSKNTGVEYLEGTTYQEIIKNEANKTFAEKMPKKIKEFYGF